MTRFESRTRACQERLRAVDADGAVFFPGPNLYYLSGFFTEPWDRHFFLIVPKEGEPCFVVPQLFEAQVAESTSVEAIETWTDEEGPFEAIRTASDVVSANEPRLLVDDEMWATFLLDLRDGFDGATFDPAREVMDELREIKDEAEVDRIARASSIADDVSVEVRSLGDRAIGMTERELAIEIERRLVDRGADGLAFDVSSSSGPNTARVFYHHGDREIESGDPVLLDFGCVVDHYCSDQTRMVVFDGEPSERFLEVYRAVEEAKRTGIEAVEPGIPAAAIEEPVHRVLENHGLLEYVQHRTGHGVGMTPYEGPDILRGNETSLEPGMVFSVEPGVYVEGKFGVRLEDLVVVTEDGHRRLNTSPETWRPL